MKKIKILIVSVLCCAMGYTGYTAYEKMTMSEAEKFMIANVEALTSNESGGESAPCKDTGYKKWFGTSNNPLQRKEYFHDCFCRDKEGYDPVNC